MPRKRPTPACSRCRHVRRANAVLDEQILLVKARLLEQLRAAEERARNP